MVESPYVFTRSEGLVHIRLRSAPAKCIACVRADGFDIIWLEARREALGEAMEAARKAAI